MRALRQWLKKKSNGKDLRCRWLMISSSVQLWDGSRAIIEFDGAIVRVSARSGEIQVFALETKMGSENPATSLRRSINALGLLGQVSTLSNNFAVFEFTA